MKFCINCQNFRKSPIVPNDLRMGRCARKEILHPVDGKEDYPYAEMERSHTGTCKPEGNHWKSIQEVHDFRDYKTSSTNHDLDQFGRPLKEGT